MTRTTRIRTAAVLTLAVATFAVMDTSARGALFTWDGGSASWASNNWNGGGPPPTMDGTDDATIGSGTATWFAGGDFTTLPGSDITIDTGGAWVTPDGSWTRINGGLNLYGGTFTRTGPGNLAFGTPDAPASTTINIGLFKGGAITDPGDELWFGWAPGSPAGLTVNMTINDGSVTSQDGGGADWWLWDDTVSDYSINFTGPGTITLGNAGIRRESDAAQVSFETLWDAGILQAHGASGLTGATFSDFFAVTGNPGDSSYILTSNVLPIPEPASLALAALGFLSLGVTRRRRRR